MFELFILVFFVWLMIKATVLSLKLTWGLAKITASILMVLALPLLILSLLFVGGLAIVAPVAIICIAIGIMKTCVDI